MKVLDNPTGVNYQFLYKAKDGTRAFRCPICSKVHGFPFGIWDSSNPRSIWYNHAKEHEEEHKAKGEC